MLSDIGLFTVLLHLYIGLHKTILKRVYKSFVKKIQIAECLCHCRCWCMRWKLCFSLNVIIWKVVTSWPWPRNLVTSWPWPHKNFILQIGFCALWKTLFSSSYFTAKAIYLRKPWIKVTSKPLEKLYCLVHSTCVSVALLHVPKML